MRRPGGKKPLDDKYAGDPKAAQTAAIALLARRDFSLAELRRRLKERGYLPSAIERYINFPTGPRSTTNAMGTTSWRRAPVAGRARPASATNCAAPASTPRSSRPRWTAPRKTGRTFWRWRGPPGPASSVRKSPKTAKNGRGKPDFCNTGAFQRIISALFWRGPPMTNRTSIHPANPISPRNLPSPCRINRLS